MKLPRRAHASSAEAPDPDVQLEWTPIRDVPSHFQACIARAQRALGRYVAGENDRDLAIVQREWDRVVGDRRFAAAPVTFRLDLLNRSAVAWQWRDAREGTTSGAETALERLNEALALAPPGEDRSLYLHNVGMVHLLAFQLAGTEGRLDAAIDALREAITAAGDDARRRALASSGAASALSTRFRIGGAVRDIEEAVSLASAAVAEARADSPRRSRYQDILSGALAYRFDALGRIDDLERAIAAGRAASGDGASVASLLRRRWEIVGDRRDLDASIDTQRRSVETSSRGNLPALLTNLGNALLDRYQEFSDIADLHDAAAAHDRSVELTPAGDWQLASRHNNGGNSALSLYEATGDPETLALALRHYERAVALTPPSAQELPSREYNLGNARRSAYQHTGEESDAVAAVDAYRAACVTGLATSLQWALAASAAWTGWAVERAAWEEAVEASERGIDAIDQLFRRQIGRDEKERWLARAATLPGLAAFALCSAGRPVQAVVAVERGRAFLLSEALERDRADLDRLAAGGHADLVERYRSASAVLRAADA